MCRTMQYLRFTSKNSDSLSYNEPPKIKIKTVIAVHVDFHSDSQTVIAIHVHSHSDYDCTRPHHFYNVSTIFV